MDYLISIVIPVYKTESTLRRCLNSALNQTYRDVEIILVDDGSPDNSARICDEYASKNSHIKVIHKKDNEGLLLARKTGINASRGKYILNMDSDDYIESSMIDNLIKADDGNSSDIISSGFFMEYQDGSTFARCDGVKEGVYNLSNDYYIYSRFIYNGSFLNNGILPALWCKLIKKEILQRVYEGLNLRLNMQEDALATYGSIGMADSICVTKQCFYHYCIVNESMSRKTNENYYIDINNVYKSLKELFRHNHYRCLLFGQLDLYMMYWSYAGICEYFGLDKKNTPPYFTFDTDIVPESGKVVLYGAGRVGQSYFKVCTQKGIRIVSWIDKNYIEYRDSNHTIDSVDIIKTIQFDYILVALKSETDAKRVKKHLVLDHRIPEDKILCPKALFELDKYVNWE